MEIEILIMDDDLDLCRLLKKCLESEGYGVDVAHDGLNGLKMLHHKNYHLIILDIMMPKMDGMTTITKIRDMINTPVLMLSAKDSEIDKVAGLKSGADDYLTKPFNLSELTARVQSLIRRYVNLGAIKNESNKLIYGPLEIDPSYMRATLNGKDLNLTGKEFSILSFFASHPGQIFTKRQIYQQVWGEEYAYDDNNIMVHIRRLRKKIEPDPNNPSIILTAWGLGYKFNGDAFNE